MSLTCKDPARAALGPLGEVPEGALDRLLIARVRLRQAAERGLRIIVYNLALDLDMSEFHFTREFHSAFGWSPLAYYNEVRAACARDLLRQGLSQGAAARRVGLRRPAELRRLLARRSSLKGMAEVRRHESRPPAGPASGSRAASPDASWA